MANNNKRKFDRGDESPNKRNRRDENIAKDGANMTVDFAPLITPLSTPAGTRASRLELGRNPGISGFSISRFLLKWVSDLDPNIRERFWKRMVSRELIEQRLVTTRILLEFIDFVTHELTPFLWQIELCYGLDTNDWLKTTKEFEDHIKFSSLLARIFNRYMSSVEIKIPISVLNNYQEWFNLASIIERDNVLSQDFSLYISSKEMLDEQETARTLFPFQSNVPRFVSKLLALPQCQWPVIITPYYAGFVVHKNREGSNVALIYAFALPYAITCLPEYIDFRPSVMRQGRVRFHLAFSEPVPWRDGEALQNNIIEYVDLELDLLAMEKHVLARLDTDVMRLIPIQRRDDSPFGVSQNSSSSSASDSLATNLFIPIPYEKDAYTSMRPATTQRKIKQSTLFHGVYTTEQDARLTYNHKEVLFQADIMQHNKQPQQRTTWMNLLGNAARATPNAFLRKFSILRDFNQQNEMSMLTSGANECKRVVEFIINHAMSGEYILSNVDVAADRGEVYFAVLQYDHSEKLYGGINKNLFELFSHPAKDKRLKHSLSNHVTIALAFTEDRPLTPDDDDDVRSYHTTSQPSPFWRVALLFVGVGKSQTLNQALHVNNCVVGYCHEGITLENKQQAHIMQMSWSFIQQACDIKNNKFPEIDERNLELLDYGHVLTLPIDASESGPNQAHHYYSCAISHWQMSRGMVIVYSNHNSAGNNQLDRHNWLNATLAHYDGAHWMVKFEKQGQPHYYVVQLSGSHIRAYDSIIYDKGVFYQTSARTLEPSERSFSQMFDDFIIDDDEEERKKLQHFQLSLTHYAERKIATPIPELPIDSQNVEMSDV